MTLTDLIAVVAASVGGVGVAVAVIGIVVQFHQARKTAQIENLNREVDGWNSAEMQRLRAEAADAILREQKSLAISKVLTFFEELGYLTRRRALDSESVWTMFSDWVLPYCVAASGYIDAERDMDLTFWENLVWLDKHLLQIESRRRGRALKAVRPSAEMARELMRSEVEMAARPRSRTFRSWRRMEAQAL